MVNRHRLINVHNGGVILVNWEVKYNSHKLDSYKYHTDLERYSL